MLAGYTGTLHAVSLRRVVPLPTPRMTLGDALHRLPAPSHHPILRDGVDRVLAARGMESALSAEQSREGGAIEDHDEDAESLRDRHETTRTIFSASRCAADRRVV